MTEEEEKEEEEEEEDDDDDDDCAFRSDRFNISINLPISGWGFNKHNNFSHLLQVMFPFFPIFASLL